MNLGDLNNPIRMSLKVMMALSCHTSLKSQLHYPLSPVKAWMTPSTIQLLRNMAPILIPGNTILLEFNQILGARSCGISKSKVFIKHRTNSAFGPSTTCQLSSGWPMFDPMPQYLGIRENSVINQAPTTELSQKRCSMHGLARHTHLSYSNSTRSSLMTGHKLTCHLSISIISSLRRTSSQHLKTTNSRRTQWCTTRILTGHLTSSTSCQLLLPISKAMLCYRNIMEIIACCKDRAYWGKQIKHTFRTQTFSTTEG